MRILLAEDNIINQKLVTQVLKKRGHVIDIASDGMEALLLFESNGGHDTYDVLLIDEEMPKMKGIFSEHFRWYLKKIRNRSDSKNTRN